MAQTPEERNSLRRARYAAQRAEKAAAGITRSERSLRRDRAELRDAAAARGARERENFRKRYVYAIRKLTRRYAAVNPPLRGDLTAGQAWLETMSYPDAVAFVEDMEAGYAGRRDYHGKRSERPHFASQAFVDAYNALPSDDPRRARYWYD